MLGIFLDLETTGLDPFRHRVGDIAFSVVDLASGEELEHYQSIVKQPSDVWESKDSTSVQINGLSWEKISQGKKETEIREEILTIFSRFKISRGRSFFICQNPSFDRSFFSQIVPTYTQEKLNWPYHWLDLASMYWALQIKEWRASKTPLPASLTLSKNAIAAHFHLPPEITPHSASNGVRHLLLCYTHTVGF